MRPNTATVSAKPPKATLTRSAALLIDLQQDFLDEESGRMPVNAQAAIAVIETANAILAKELLACAVPILVVNQFDPRDRIANLFRRGAALAGARGADIDPRIRSPRGIKIVAKNKPSAFTNPELDSYLRAEEVGELYVMGVFAEGCVRSTVLDAGRRGYRVHVIADAIATDAQWKKRFALWAMTRAGADITTSKLCAG